MKVKDKTIYTLVVGKTYSAYGYFYMAIAQSHKADEIHILTDALNKAKAKVVIYLLKLNMWQDSEIPPEEKILYKYSCQKCGKSSEKKIDYCPTCNSPDFKPYSIHSTKVILEKSGVLQSNQESLLSNKKFKHERMLIEGKDMEKKAEDVLLLRGWAE